MMKRFFAVLLALLVLFVAVTSWAEDFDDDFDDSFDEFGEEWEDWEEEWDDWEEDDFEDPDDEDIQSQKAKIDEASGYKDIDYKKDGGFRFFVSEDGQSAITDRYEGYDLEVTVPDTLGGLPVTAIGPNTFQDCKLEKVILPDTIEIIDRQAFFKCEGLKTIVLPEGVQSIGYCAFAGCISLESIEIPESLETVDEFCFLNCLALTEIRFSANLKSIGPNAFNLCMALTHVVLPKDAEIDDTAFTNCPENMEKEFLS